MRYRLKDIFDLQMGKTPARQNMKYWDKSDCKWISIADLSRSEKYISNTKEKISDIAVKETGIRVIPANTVIMSFKLSIGKVAITADNMYSNEAIMAFNDKHVVEMLPEYIFYMFKYMRWDSGSNNAVMGKTLNKATISEIEIDICSIKKQQEIVAILDKMDNILSNKYKNIYLLDELVKARFIEVFGDPVLNSMKWEEHKLSEYILFMTSGSRGWSKYFTDDGSEVFITIKNVKNNKITLKEIQFVNAPDDKEAKRTKVQAGDLLISITADLGRTGIVGNEIAKQGAYINQHLSLIRLDVSKINPHFVSYYLETEAGKRQFASKNQSAVKAGLSFESIKSLKIFVPPMELQRDYVLFTEQADKSKAVIEKSLKELETLQASLMQKYFS